MPEIVYLGLGSNMGDRVGYVQQAMRMLKSDEAVRILSASSFYETEPVLLPESPQDQDWYVNVAVAIETRLPPEKLLDACQLIERQLGRIRDPRVRWGPRTIDIDILFYGNLILNLPNLVLPHPQVHLRACTLVPLLEINPRFMHPVLGKTIEQLHHTLDMPEEVLLYGTRGY